MTWRKPDYRLRVDGREITPLIEGRLDRLTLTDNRGIEADTLDLTLSDHDGQVPLPPRGAIIELALGWAGEALVEKGQFVVDEAEAAGPPDVITLRAHAAEVAGELLAKRTRSWQYATVGEIVEQIAAEHELEPVIDERLASRRRPATHQTGESDLNLLTRLGRHYDALVTLKSGRLLFLPAGTATTASGTPLPALRVKRHQVEQHRFARVERDHYTGVRAQWQDYDAGQMRYVLAGSVEHITALPETYPNEEDAMAAAAAELARLQRGAARLELTLVEGMPDLIPETPVNCGGFKPEVEQQEWIAARITHTVDRSGFITAMECETRQDSIEVAAEQLP